MGTILYIISTLALLKVKAMTRTKLLAKTSTTQFLFIIVLFLASTSSFFLLNRKKVASFPDLPAHPQTLYVQLFFYPLKAITHIMFAGERESLGTRLLFPYLNEKRMMSLNLLSNIHHQFE